MGLELHQEEKTDGPCPMCGQTAEWSLNAAGRPYFTCRSKTCSTTVNLNGDEAEEMVREYANGAETVSLSIFEDDETTEDETDISVEQTDETTDNDDEKTLEDIFGGN